MNYKIKEYFYQNPYIFFLSACLFFLTIFPNLSKAQSISDYDPNISNVLAFPGAEGFGRYTTGGRGGQVIKVTNLNDSGPGSLRQALESRGPRIVIFEVSGNINLKSRIIVYGGDLTIAGQTAPGDGITLTNYSLFIGADNVIIRFLRFRLGDLISTTFDDPIQARFQKNIIIDHCSASWGTDETASFYANENFTLQWCIISEGLNNSIHSKGAHGFGGLWGGKNASFHHNLIAHFTQRSPAFDNLGLYTSESQVKEYRGVVDFRNNVVYNWSFRAIEGGEKGTFNVINNYFKPGPATGTTSHFLFPTSSSASYGKYFVSGNILVNNSTVNSDNWKGVRLETTPLSEQYLQSTKLSSPLPSEVYEYNHTAQNAYSKVLDFAGASSVRDAVDNRIVTETRNRTYTFNGSRGSTNGIIDSQRDVGSWPVLKSLPAPMDTDGDGLPDSWETANNLNPNTTNDREFNLNPYYTDIEVYVNSLVQGIINQTNPGAPEAVSLLLPVNNATVTPVDISFAWSPNSNASFYRIQISKSPDFSTNVTTTDNIKNLSTIRNQLDPSSTYYWRVRATNTSGNGPYSAIGMFKTGSLSQIPERPLLISPKSNSLGITISPHLFWSEVPNTKNYRLQVSTQSTFSTILIDQSNLTTTSLQLSKLNENTLYYWRVRASNDFGNSSYSISGSFTTVSFDTIPAVTILKRPAHNTTVNPVGIRLEWEPNPTAEFYLLQVSTSSDFSNTSNYIINKSGLTDTFFIIENLDSNKIYFWRVRAYNRKTYDYHSSTFTLKTSAFTQTPSKIKLLSQADDANIFSTSIKFTWEEPIAKSYRLQVSTSENFSSFVSNISGITATSSTVSNLTRNTQYFWRIIPSNEAGIGTTSETRKVRSASSSSTISGPKLTSPADKSSIPSNNILFKWENQPNSAFYRIQISTNLSFSNLTLNVTNIPGTSFLVPKLNNNTTYYWRVRGATSSVTGAYSQVYSFKTGTESITNLNLVLENPKNNAVGQSSPLTLSWQANAMAESYTLEVAESNSFISSIISQSGLISSSFSLQNLEPNTNYYWRVTPTINGSKANPSETWIFTTEGTSESLFLTESLVGHWKMDEGKGNIFIDHSGTGNNASIPNAAGITWIPGKIGQASLFNTNSGAFGLVPHNPTIDITDQITIAAWIRPNAVENKGILSKLNGDGYEFRIFSDGKLEFRINRATNGTLYRLRSDKSYVADGKIWTHVAVTFNGTKSTIFINGVEDNAATFNSVRITSNTSDLRIGAIGNGNMWNGGLDDVKLYNKALSSSEILEMSNGINMNARTFEGLEKKQNEEKSTLELKDTKDENVDVGDIKIFPNPVQEELHIQLNSLKSTQLNISIYDLMGRKYMEKSVFTEDGQIMIDFSEVNMAQGMYLLILDNGLLGMKKIKFLKK